VAEYPQLLHTVLDSTTPRELAEFSRHLLGLRYRLGDEPPADGAADSADLPVLVDSAGMRSLAFQQVDQLARTTWPSHDAPMQLHLDFTVSRRAAVRVCGSVRAPFLHLRCVEPTARHGCATVSGFRLPTPSSEV